MALANVRHTVVPTIIVNAAALPDSAAMNTFAAVSPTAGAISPADWTVAPGSPTEWVLSCVTLGAAPASLTELDLLHRRQPHGSPSPRTSFALTRVHPTTDHSYHSSGAIFVLPSQCRLWVKRSSASCWRSRSSISSQLWTIASGLQ